MMNMKNLKLLRKSMNMTLRQLADELGTSVQVLSRYERGEHQADYGTLERTARFFNVSIDYLLGYKAVSLPSCNAALKNDEAELLELYRKLPYENKQRLIARAEVMLEDGERKTSTSVSKRV